MTQKKVTVYFETAHADEQLLSRAVERAVEQIGDSCVLSSHLDDVEVAIPITNVAALRSIYRIIDFYTGEVLEEHEYLPADELIRNLVSYDEKGVAVFLSVHHIQKEE